MCYPCGVGLHRVLRSATDGLLTPGKPAKHDVCVNSVYALDFTSDVVVTIPQLETSSEDLFTMNSSEDEPLSGLNGRLRPRRTTGSPQAKIVKKVESKTSQDKPKRTSTPSKAFSNKTDDLANKSDSFPVTLFLCPYCDRKFASKQTVSKHARRMHLSTSKQDCFIACLYCNHTEAEANNIIRHMVDSHPNQYFACLDCHTRFPSTSELAEHKLNVCEKQKPYRSKLRQKTSSSLKRNQKNLSTDRKDEFTRDKEYSHGFNGIVISCELKPSQVHDEADIEDNITTNLILPPSKSLASNAVIEKNAVIVLDDIQWNKRIPPNFSFHNTDADQILSRLGVVHRSPRTGESTRRDWFKTIDDSTQKFEKCFDTSFYSKVASNVQENLAKCLDGSFNFNPDIENTIKTRKAKNSVVINTAEGFPILLAFEQYSRNMFDSYMPRSIAPKHKWKWDNLETDKVLISPDQIQRDSHTNNCIITLVSSLDIWTQLRMRKKFEDKFNISHVEKKTVKQNLIDKELKEILESRELPPSSSQLVKFTSNAGPSTGRLDIPSYLGLTPSAPRYDIQPAVLSGEWVRPRCYVCCACGAQTRDCKALSSHISLQHPNAQVQHYEIVGEPLLNADILKHLYVPPSQVANRTRPLRGIRDCTKCKKSVTLEELHQHMLDCAGDTPTVRRNKCRYRPFGVRRRRPRLPDNTIRRKIRKDMRNGHKQKNHMRPRQKIRSEVGDAETIRRMIADLPAKRHRVLLNPTNQALRPRRKIERGKLILKHRSTDEAKNRNLRTVKDINNTSKLEKKPNDKEEQKTNVPDNEDNDKSLKPKRRLAANNSRLTNLKRKPVVTRAKRKIKIKSDGLPNSSDLQNVGPSKELQKEGTSVNDTSNRIDVNNSHSNARQHSGRGGNFNRGNNQEAREGNINDNNNAPLRQNDDTNNDAPVQNSPLKHSIARLTADTERHDKSVLFQPHFLIQQECNNTNQHVPTGQQELFENEAPDVTLDKPPLSSNQKETTDPSAFQKTKPKGSRKGKLNACIDKLRNKLSDPIIGSPEKPVQDPPVSSTEPSAEMLGQREHIEPVDPHFLQGPPIDSKIDPKPAEVYSHSVGPEAYKDHLNYQKYLEQTQAQALAYGSIQPTEVALTDNETLASDQVVAPPKESGVPDTERPETPVKRQSTRLRSSTVQNTKQTMFGLPSQIEVIPQKPTSSPRRTPQSRQRKNSEQPSIAKESGMILTDPALKSVPDPQLNMAHQVNYHKRTTRGRIIDSMPSTSFQQPADATTIQKQLFSEQGSHISIPHGDPLYARSKSLDRNSTKSKPDTGKILDTVLLAEQIALMQQSPYNDPRSYLGLISCMPAVPFAHLAGGYAEQMAYPNIRSDLAAHMLVERQRIHQNQQIHIGQYPPRVPVNHMIRPEQRQRPELKSVTDARTVSGQSLPERGLSSDNELQLTKEKTLLPAGPDQGPSNKRRCPMENQPEHELPPPKRRLSTEHWVAKERWPLFHISEGEKLHLPKEQLRVIESSNSSQELKTTPEPYLTNDTQNAERRVSIDKSIENNARRFSNDNSRSDGESPMKEQTQTNERAQKENLTSREQLLIKYHNFLQNQIHLQGLAAQAERVGESQKTNLNTALSEHQLTVQDKLTYNRRLSESRQSMERKPSSERPPSQPIQSVDQRYKDVLKLSPNVHQNICAISPRLELTSELGSTTKVLGQERMENTLRMLPPHIPTDHFSSKPPEIDRMEPLDLSAKNSDVSLIEPELVVNTPQQLTARTPELPAESQLVDLKDNRRDEEFRSRVARISEEQIMREDHYIPQSRPRNVGCYGESNRPEYRFPQERESLVDLTQEDKVRKQGYSTVDVKTETHDQNIEKNNASGLSPGYTPIEHFPINRIPEYRRDQYRHGLNVMEANSGTTIFKQNVTPESDQGKKARAGQPMNIRRGIGTGIPFTIPDPLNKANIEPLPVYTLPNPISAATTANKHEVTSPVYTLARTCIAVTKIETSTTVPLTSALLSTPSTTLTSTKSLQTFTNTSIPEKLKKGIKSKKKSLKHKKVKQNIPLESDGNDTDDSETEIEDDDNAATNKLIQDPEMAKKIAMLPKELVEVLQTMPASHRNQLLNILPQYVSTSTSSTKSSSNSKASDVNKQSSSNEMIASPEQQAAAGMQGIIPNYLLSSNMQSQFFKSFNSNDRHALSYLLQPPPPPPSQYEFSGHPPLRPPPSLTDLVTSVTVTQNIHVVQYPLASPLPPLPPNTPPAYARPFPLIIKTDESGEDVKPLVGTIKPKEELHTENSSGIYNLPHGSPVEPEKECSDNETIDLTEDDNSATRGRKKSIIVPTTNIINFTALIQTQKPKVGNDQTASLRAVRIKTASERNKSSADSQMPYNMITDTEVPILTSPVVDEENQLCGKTTSLAETTSLTKPVEQFDQEIIPEPASTQYESSDGKSPELNVTLAIQQAEISSTQQNKNITVPCTSSITESPMSPELPIESRDDTSPNHDTWEPDTESNKKDTRRHQVENASPPLMVTSSIMQRNSPTLDPRVLQNDDFNKGPQLVDDSNKERKFETSEILTAAETSTTAKQIPFDNEYRRLSPPKILITDKDALEGDDSDDDISLAVIVKNRITLKNMTCKSKESDNISADNLIEKQKDKENKRHEDVHTRTSKEKIISEKREGTKTFDCRGDTSVDDIIQTEQNSASTRDVGTVKHQDEVKVMSQRTQSVKDNEVSETNKNIMKPNNLDEKTTTEINDKPQVNDDIVEIENSNLQENTDKRAKKSVQISNVQNDKQHSEKGFDSDLKLREIDENATPLRRSRRGKSMYVDSPSVEQDHVSVPEACHEQRTPLTKKQLIFSKLLLDEENHNIPQAHSTPQSNLKTVNNDIPETNEMPAIVISQPPNIEIETPHISPVEKRKVPKRKKSVKIKRKYKKKKSTEIDNEIQKEQKKDDTTDVAVTSDAESITDAKNNSDLKENNQSNPKDLSKEDLASDNLNIKEDTTENLCASAEKRTLGEVTVDICDKNVKIKKPKLLIGTDDDLEKKLENNNETNVTKMKEKTSFTAETRTTCYMPAARRTRSKSVIVKSSTTDFYDPYDIDLDDMIENTETFKHKKYTHNAKGDLEDKSTKENDKKAEDPAREDTTKTKLKKTSKNKDQPQITSDDFRTTTNDMSDSDDSSKSDVPLKKYIEHKEKKSLHSDKPVTNHREDDDTNEEATNKHSNTKGNKQQKKSRRTLATFNDVDKSSVNNDADERRSEQFMESFGFFSERKPRKSNLLASKKISETFHIIANESDDAYFSTSKNKPTKRALQNENKKSSSGNSRLRRQTIGKRIIKRAPLSKKQVCLPVPTYCRICRRRFRRSDNFMRHQMTLYHISKLSEAELKNKTFPIVEEPNYLVAFRQQLERVKKIAKKVAKNKNNPKYAKIKIPIIDEVLEKVNKIVEKQLLAQRGLSRDEALFLDCCQLLKSNKYEVNNLDQPILNIEPDRYMCTQCLLKQYELLEKQSEKDDGDVDSITAKNIFESEEVRNLEKDLISGFTEAANAGTLEANNYPRSITDESDNQDDDHTMDTYLNEDEAAYEQKEIIPETPDKVEKREVKDKMYPDIVECDMFEDKFDKIKRKCRSQAAAAKQTQAVIEPTIGQKARRKSEKKTVRRNSKKIRQGSQVLTKGALKGFDGIKVSIPTSDINMAAIVPSLDASPKKKKKNSSKKKKEKDPEAYVKLNTQPHKDTSSSSRKDIDVYEFMDNEDAEVFEFRPSTLMERFKSISNKDAPSTSKVNPVVDENEDTENEESMSDGDDFVYDDYACSEDETESSISCELNQNKINTELKKTSLLKRKDVTEKNAVMGKIFKHNAVRSDKIEELEQAREDTPEPVADMDQLFDSLLDPEPNSSMLNNDAVTPEKDDFVTPKPYDNYNRTTPTVDECPSPPLIRDIMARSPSPSDFNTSPLKSDDSKLLDDVDASTSKNCDEDSEIIDYGPSTSKKHDINLSKDSGASSPKKLDQTSSNKQDNSNKHKSRRHSGSSPTRNERSHKTCDIEDTPPKEKSPSMKLDEGISTSYDYSADLDQIQYDDMGVARQRARRKCTVGKQNVLAETWSSESEPDGLPPRPNSAESVVLSFSRKRKGKKKDSQSGARRHNNRHISFKRQDDIRVSNSNRSAASSSVVGQCSSAGVLPPPSASGSKPRPRSSTYYWSSENDEEQEHVQQHGWIVGDSHKKLVTMLAHAKGRKRNTDDKSHLLE